MHTLPTIRKSGPWAKEDGQHRKTSAARRNLVTQASTAPRETGFTFSAQVQAVSLEGYINLVGVYPLRPRVSTRDRRKARHSRANFTSLRVTLAGALKRPAKGAAKASTGSTARAMQRQRQKYRQASFVKQSYQAQEVWQVTEACGVVDRGYFAALSFGVTCTYKPYSR
jgi:hypothetical protein